MIVTIFFGFVSRSNSQSKETLKPVNVFSDEFHKNNVKSQFLPNSKGIPSQLLRPSS